VVQNARFSTDRRARTGIKKMRFVQEGRGVSLSTSRIFFFFGEIICKVLKINKGGVGGASAISFQLSAVSFQLSAIRKNPRFVCCS
jgi:hypothetical protein